jgi:hypothetical protein
MSRLSLQSVDPLGTGEGNHPSGSERASKDETLFRFLRLIRYEPAR